MTMWKEFQCLKIMSLGQSEKNSNVSKLNIYFKTSMSGYGRVKYVNKTSFIAVKFAFL